MRYSDSRTQRMSIGILVVQIALFVPGCVHEPQLRDEPFGQSVRHMILVQTTDPGREPLGLDGEKALKALEDYRSGDGLDGDSGGLADALDLGGGSSGN